MMDNENICIYLTKIEIEIMYKILLEICYGLEIKNFQLTIGVIDDVEFLFEKIFNTLDKSLDKQIYFKFELNKKDFNILSSAFIYVHQELIESEFQTRTGYNKEDSLKLFNRLRTAFKPSS